MQSTDGVNGPSTKRCPEEKLDVEDVQNASIFVSVINYRDCEGQFTLMDLFAKAANPSRVHVGYCIQYDPVNDSQDMNCHFSDLVQSGKNIRALYVAHTEARGPIYARYLVQNELFCGQKYYLQLDCHMRFIQDWDEMLIKTYHQCGDTKAVVTTYPAPYDSQYLPLLKTHFVSMKDWEGTLKNPLLLEMRSSLLCADRFGKGDGFLRIRSKTLHKIPAKPMPSLFVAAGFCFSLSTVIKECPLDPNLQCMFFGEETITAARLYTNGYNFYAPTRSICYHLWDRNNVMRKGVWRELFEDEKLKPKLVELENRSKERVKRILSGDIKPSKEDVYGLGTERTLEEYQAFCGVDFTKIKMTDDAKFGGIEESQRMEMFEEFQQNKLMDMISSFQT